MDDEDTVPPQNPPEGFVPQTDLAQGQVGGIIERPPDAVTDAEDEDPDSQSESDGAADGDDDDVDDGDDS